MQAGRPWQRLHLRATTQGLAMQPLDQLTELADREVMLGSVSRLWRDRARVGRRSGLAGAANVPNRLSAP